MGFKGELRSKIRRVASMYTLLLFLSGLSACGPNRIVIQAGPPTDADGQENNGGSITINVSDQSGNLIEEGAVARVLTTDISDDQSDGMLTLGGCLPGQKISVWASGYYISTQTCNLGRIDYTFSLNPISTHPDPSYAWKPAATCGGCHPGIQIDWGLSGHARIYANRYFEMMYRGFDSSGVTIAPSTTKSIIDDNLVLNAQNDQNSTGPGFKLDFPGVNGNCAFCHAPAAVTSAQVEVDPFADPTVIVREGVSCDLCHKVLNIELDKNGYPHVTRPGILSLEYLIPPEAPNFSIGPSVHVDAEHPEKRMTCSTIMGKSEFCAACHFGEFNGVLIYGSYKEWKDSDYGRDPAMSSYRPCQNCHMSNLVSGKESPYPAGKDACSAQRPPSQNINHNFMHIAPDMNGRNISKMIENAAEVDVGFGYDPINKNWLNVIPKVTSINVGHRFPTDSPLRHLILVVEAWDERNTSLIQVAGERIPNWAGTDEPPLSPEILNYGGMAGKIYANLLVESDTNMAPTASYWNEIKYAWVGNLQNDPYDYSDTRLLPGRTDISSYGFTGPEIGDIKVRVRLIYRFAFLKLMRQKNWSERADILVADVECQGPPTDPSRIICTTIK